MHRDPQSTPADGDTSQSSQNADSSTTVDNPSSNQIDRDFLKEKPPLTAKDGDEESLDGSKDTTSRTSTRLVKFQLFETKTVPSSLNCIDMLAVLHSRI